MPVFYGSIDFYWLLILRVSREALLIKRVAGVTMMMMDSPYDLHLYTNCDDIERQLSSGFPRVRKMSGKNKFLKVREESGNVIVSQKILEFFQKSGKIKSKRKVCMSQVKSKMMYAAKKCVVMAVFWYLLHLL